jgi:hypothetical protein
VYAILIFCLLTGQYRVLSTIQCCGTVTIFFECGSGSDFGKIPVPVPDPEHIRIVQNLAFIMLGAALFPKKLSFVFHFTLDPDPNLDPEPQPECICSSGSCYGSA